MQRNDIVMVLLMVTMVASAAYVLTTSSTPRITRAAMFAITIGMVAAFYYGYRLIKY